MSIADRYSGLTERRLVKDLSETMRVIKEKVGVKFRQLPLKSCDA